MQQLMRKQKLRLSLLVWWVATLAGFTVGYAAAPKPLAPEPVAYTLHLELQGMPASIKAPYLYVWSFKGKELLKRDSVAYSAGMREADFSFTWHEGQYKVGFFPQVSASIMLGEQQRVDATLTYDGARNVFQAHAACDDDKAWKACNALQGVYSTRFNELVLAYQKHSHSGTEEERHQRLVELYEATYTLADSLNTEFRKIQDTWPRTYTANIAVPMFLSVIPPEGLGEMEALAFRRDRHFDYIDLENPAILRCEQFSSRAFQYINDFSANREISTFKGLVDGMLANEVMVQPVYDFLTCYFLEIFDLRGPGELVNHIVDTYLPSVQDTTPLAHTILKRQRGFERGNAAVDVTMPDTSGTPQTFSENLGDKFTLLYIWSTGCSHCIASIPRVKQLYATYHTDGFNVYAVCIDQDKEAWKSFVAYSDLNWVNVSDGNGFASPIIPAYGVKRTPLKVLVDSDFNIVEYDVQMETLERLLAREYGY